MQGAEGAAPGGEQGGGISTPVLPAEEPVRQQPLNKGLFLPPLLQAVLAGIGLLITVLLAGLALGMGGLALASGSPNEELLPLFSSAWSMLLVAALFIPALVFAARRLKGRPAQPARRRWLGLSLAAVLLWAPLVLLGQLLANNGVLPWLFLPPLQVIAVLAPILLLVELGRRRLPHPPGSLFGVYTFGVVITQPFVLAVEIVLLAAIGVLGATWVSLNPDLLDVLLRTARRLQDANFDPRLLDELVTPFLRQPGVIYLGLAVGAGLIPLLEELLKPLALWVMVGRRFTRAEGFVLGLFAGGTFALLESLGIAASVGVEGWSGILMARVGTGILHITTTGLVGLGMGLAWEQRRYVQLGFSFFLAFLLHSLWNLLGLLLGVQAYLPSSPALSSITLIGPVALGILATTMVFVLLGLNARLRRLQPAQPVHTGSLEHPEINTE